MFDFNFSKLNNTRFTYTWEGKGKNEILIDFLLQCVCFFLNPPSLKKLKRLNIEKKKIYFFLKLENIDKNMYKKFRIFVKKIIKNNLN